MSRSSPSPANELAPKEACLDDETEPVDEDDRGAGDVDRRRLTRRLSPSRFIAYGVLPGAAFVLAIGVGYLKWQDFSARETYLASVQSVQAATEGTAAILSYHADTVDAELGAARDRLTGRFKDSYTSLIHDVVIPGAKQQHIAAVATVPAAASVSATQSHAVTLVFVNQTTVVGSDAPTNTTTSVKVTLDKINGRWLISDFQPI
jgi:Mce-associated membrane protein